MLFLDVKKDITSVTILLENMFEGITETFGSALRVSVMELNLFLMGTI